MPYKDKEDKNRWMREYRRKKREEKEDRERKRLQRMIPQPTPEERQREKEFKEKKNKEFEKYLRERTEREDEFDTDILDYVSPEEYENQVNEFFATIEKYEPEKEEPDEPKKLTNKPEIRKDLYPSEIEWFQRHEDVAEGRESSLLYGKDSKNTKELKQNLNGSIEVIKKESEKKENSVWIF